MLEDLHPADFLVRRNGGHQAPQAAVAVVHVVMKAQQVFLVLLCCAVWGAQAGGGVPVRAKRSGSLHRPDENSKIRAGGGGLGRSGLSSGWRCLESKQKTSHTVSGCQKERQRKRERGTDSSLRSSSPARGRSCAQRACWRARRSLRCAFIAGRRRHPPER